MIKRSFFLLVLLLLGSSLAQPMRALGELAPADTVASFGWSSQTEFIDTLKTDFAELNWMQAGETLEKLAAVLSEAGDFADFADLFEMLEQMEDQNEMLDEAYGELYDFCPNLETVVPELEALEGEYIPFDALLTVGLSAFNPIPSVTAILEMDASVAPLLVEMREALLVCAQDSGEIEISTLEQDGTTLYVIGDAGDFPVVAGSLDNLFFISTNPEALRGIIRKVNGSDEESFANTRMYQEMSSRFDAAGNHMNFSLDLAKLADAAEGFAGFVIDGPETEYLVGRGLDVLRTLGGVAGQVTASSDGLVSESIWTIDPEGGDDALAEYILCQHCNVSRPFLAPSGAVSVSSAYIPWRELYSYAETWVTDLEEITGEQVDLKEVLAEEFGFDLDVALFNWLGSEFHSVVLEPISPDIRTLLYDPGQFLFVPVSSVEAAEAGIAELQDSAAPFVMELMNEFGAGDLPGDFDMPALDSTVAVRPYSYKGTDIQRVQFSLNADLGYAFVGNYLVLGSPAKSVETAIDTFMGAPTIMRDDVYANVRTRADVPANATIFSVSEDQSSMYGLADILQSVSQPLAFGVATGLETGLNDDLDSFFEDDFFESFPADISGMTAEGFSPPGDLLGSLEEGEEDNLGNLTDFYELTDLNVGDSVTVNLSSEDFDTYLYLLDASSEDYLGENDDIDADFLSSELTFTVEEGRVYWVEVTSYDGASMGDYVLTVLTEEGDGMMDMGSDEMMDMHTDTPSYAELLDFFDLLPASVRILGDHLSTSEGFSTIDGETVYSRSKTHIIW